MAELYRMNACEFQTADQGEKALKYLDRLIALAPEDWIAQARRASVFGRLGQAAERSAAIDAAVREGADVIVLGRWADEAASCRRLAAGDSFVLNRRNPRPPAISANRRICPMLRRLRRLLALPRDLPETAQSGSAALPAPAN